MRDETISQDQGAKERAAELAGSAREQARGVAGDARQEAGAVASEASSQVGTLVDEARSAVRHQADEGTGRAVKAIGGISSELRALADGRPEEAGELRRYAGDLSDRLGSVADRLGNRGIDGIVNDVQGFARRRPGVFLAAAATTGFLAGRLFRGAQAQSSDGEQASSEGHQGAARTYPYAGAAAPQPPPPSAYPPPPGTTAPEWGGPR